MIRRLLLGLTFIAAFSFVGVGVTDTAEAWRRGRPYVGYNGGPRRAYYSRSYVPYHSYYYGSESYRSYRAYRGGYYDYYGPRSGVSVSIGF